MGRAGRTVARSPKTCARRVWSPVYEGQQCRAKEDGRSLPPRGRAPHSAITTKSRLDLVASNPCDQTQTGFSRMPALAILRLARCEPSGREASSSSSAGCVPYEKKQNMNAGEMKYATTYNGAATGDSSLPSPDRPQAGNVECAPRQDSRR